jgi:hypothetical protein
MVVKVGDKELSFDEEAVKKQLTELYMGQEIETRLREGLQTSLSKALGGVDLKNVDLDTLNLIDNFKRGFDEVVKGTKIEEEADKVF